MRQNPCATPSAIVMALDNCATGIDDLNSSSSLTIFPNPSNGACTAIFETENRDNYILKIINTVGQIICEETLNNFSGTYSRQTDISSLGKGAYVLSVTNSKNEVVKKVLAY